MRNFIREKKTYCGKQFLEVDIYPFFSNQKYKRKRSRKKKVSAPKQKNLNDKRARRYLCQLINTNFNRNDYHVNCTYSDKYLPKTKEEAENNASKFLRRINYRMKKKNIHVKYVLVTEYKNKEGNSLRPHHHIIVNGDLSREEIEDLWALGRGKNKKSIGYVNVDRLQPDVNGFEALAKYITKAPQGKKRWSTSQNLVKPETRTNDFKYSKKQIKKIIEDGEYESKIFFEKQYKGFSIARQVKKFNEVTGEWHIELRLYKQEEFL